MEALITGFFAIIILAAVIARLIKRGNRYDKRPYSYKAKRGIMTPTEQAFFRILSDAVSERYYVFAQVHLSAILEYAGKDSQSLYAFRHINQKSVDFVLCDKENLAPIYAIELDDYTHRTNKHRYDRDVEVERIFQEANMSLVRFRVGATITKEDVVRKLADAHAKQNHTS